MRFGIFLRQSKSLPAQKLHIFAKIIRLKRPQPGIKLFPAKPQNTLHSFVPFVCFSKEPLLRLSWKIESALERCFTGKFLRRLEMRRSAFLAPPSVNGQLRINLPLWHKKIPIQFFSLFLKPAEETHLRSTAAPGSYFAKLYKPKNIPPFQPRAFLIGQFM